MIAGANILRINEIFYSIQGESTRAGMPCVFVRLTGCGLRCAWCDTEYSFYDGAEMSFEEIIERISTYQCKTVEITGGEPLEQEMVFGFMSMLCDQGFDVMVETGGHVDIAPVDARVRRIVDLKCPASKMEKRNRWENISLLSPLDEVKFVVADRTDYEWAAEKVRSLDLANRCAAVLFSPVHDQLNNLELSSWILQDRLPVRFHVQLHKYIWSPETRGV